MFSVPVNPLKRPRDDDDDDMSMISRSPSPSNDIDMDMDPENIHKYDEYNFNTPNEVITTETKIPTSNKGFSMLAKLGWSAGQPLGISGDGRVDPIPFNIKTDFTGVGKISQDIRVIESTVSQRRELDSERLMNETEDQRREREDAVARRNAVQLEISDTLRPFYCSLCEKQFQNITQYNEHTNSYAHHHKARSRDMMANIRIMPQEEVEKRKDKERKREQKELRKIARASGMKLAKSAVLPSSSSQISPSSSNIPNDGNQEVRTPTPQDLVTPSGFKKSGWGPVGSITSITTHDPPIIANNTSNVETLPTIYNPALPANTELTGKAHASRMGWQQFQKSNSRRI